jgi:exosortase
MLFNLVSPTSIPVRVLWILLSLFASAVLFHSELAALFNLSLNDDRYTYAAVVPFVAVGLVLLKRKEILATAHYCFGLGIPLLTAGVALEALARMRSPHTQDLSAAICGIVILWAGGFLLLFGPKAFWIARFPLALLFLAIPIPSPALDQVTLALQDSSAYMSSILFRALGVPILRQGVIFSLPGFDIEIAPQCSGIRSSMALVIASGLAAYLFLRTAARRLLLVSVTVPLVIFKNAVRIVTLSTLALYVNQGFLHGNLHHYGGLFFSLLDLAVVIPLLLHFHKSEAGGRAPSPNAV